VHLAKYIPNILATAGILFGLATIMAGSRVLLGADPGYLVFRPLLIFNTTMGFVYVAAGIIAWRNVARGKIAAGTIFGLNAVVFGIIGYLHATGAAVAIDSIRAMTLRTTVWLMIFAGLAWAIRHAKQATPQTHQ